MASPRQPDDLRASDQDRRRVAEQLHAAAAAHYGELVPLTRDLPVEATARPVARAAPQDTEGPSVSIAIMSGTNRSGEWVVPAQHTAFALMGGVEVKRAKPEIGTGGRELTAG